MGKRTLIVAAIALFIAGLRYLSFQSDEKPLKPSPYIYGETRTEFKLPAPVFQHSLVPGGIHSISELRATMSESVFRTEFADFDFSKARLVYLKTYQLAYVSYRIGNKVFWTKHPVLLHKGELIMTDGKYSIRARCGNGVSYVPQAPEGPLEDYGTETPVPDPIQSPEFTSSLYPTEMPDLTALPPDSPIPGIPSICCSNGTILTTPPIQKVSAPEPSSWSLMFIAGGFLLVVLAIKSL